MVKKHYIELKNRKEHIILSVFLHTQGYRHRYLMRRHKVSQTMHSPKYCTLPNTVLGLEDATPSHSKTGVNTVPKYKISPSLLSSPPPVQAGDLPNTALGLEDAALSRNKATITLYLKRKTLLLWRLCIY